MAVTFRFPILLWRDEHQWWTASLLEWESVAGTGPSASAAMKQLQEYLQWLYSDAPWMSEPDFLEPVLFQHKVNIRPEYQVEQRRYPCDETVTLRLHCVRGRQKHGMLLCSLPVVDVRFYFYEENAVKKLVTHYVQQRLEGITPAGLSRLLPPAEVMLEQVAVTLKNRGPRYRPWRPDVEMLASVAEPLGDPRTRKKLSRPWERDREVNDLVRRARKEKANVLIVGETGSGKTTIMAEAVRQMERRKPDDDDDARGSARHRFWLTSGARLIAGMKYLGQWEERCEAVITELGQIGGVLCTESLLDLVREGGEGPRDSLAAFFLPYLQRGELQMISEATPSELEACRRLLPGFADVFQVIQLKPFNRGQSLTVLDRLTTTLKQNTHLEMEGGVIDLVYHLFRRFVPYQAFPGTAVGFLNRLFDKTRREQRRIRHEQGDAAEAIEVDRESVMAEFVRQTGLPELFLRDDVCLTEQEVIEHFQGIILGQEEAISDVARLVITFKAGMNDPGRPVGAFLFCGPTGVGKTALARALARYFFEHGEETDRLLRLDMSEYTGPWAGERLLSLPDGRPSELIRRVRQQPFVVILLDEIEKADPVVFDVLLNVLDEGRLTDRFGRLTTFRSAIILMTSNLGAGKQDSFGFGQPGGVAYSDEAMKFFRPEFFNRLDGVVTFHALDEQTIEGITRKELKEIEKREGIARHDLTIHWSDALVKHLSSIGFDPRYGARPLQRALESQVITLLAQFLLNHTDLDGKAIAVDLDENQAVVIRAIDQ